MRMAPPHLLLERPRHGLRVELVPLLSDHDLERELEQQIAQLVAQLDGVAAAQGLIELERFLDQIGAQRVAALGMVPRAAGSQVAHQRERATEGGVTGGGLSRRMFGHATTIIARASNRFIVLHLARPRDIIRAPVSVSVRGRDQRAWVEVDLAAVIENARTVARVAGTRLLPVVKANAYGVGAVAVSKALEALDPWGYGVATVEEGAELRAAGIARPVLVFMPAQAAFFDDFERFRLTPGLGDADAIGQWTARAGEGGPRAFHLEIDTGMGRSGVRWDEIERVREVANTPALEGCFTQFHSAERRDGSLETQVERFLASIGKLPRRPALLHVANSAAALADRRYAFDMVRPGVFLYGGSPGAGLSEPRPVVRLRARVLAVRHVAAGESVSYGALWTAP